MLGGETERRREECEIFLGHAGIDGDESVGELHSMALGRNVTRWRPLGPTARRASCWLGLGDSVKRVFAYVRRSPPREIPFVAAPLVRARPVKETIRAERIGKSEATVQKV
eukprot:2202522-Pyramimonas_sp.AAC.1